MKKYIILFVQTILLLSITTSCSDFLQKDPPSAPSQSVFWKTKSDFEAALAACYSSFYADCLSAGIPDLDNLTDNSVPAGDMETIALGDLTPYSEGYPHQLYSSCYKGIARIHILLDQLEKYKGTDINESDRIYFTAQCKALRGYYYYWLYMCYREVPLVTDVVTFENMYREKTPRIDIYNQIINDFDEAIATLPDKLYSDPKEAGHITVSAVKVLKARILLHTAYDESGMATDKSKLNEVISILESVKGYKLAESMRDNFLTEKQDASPEIIFSVKFARPNILHNMDQRYEYWCQLNPTRDLVDEFECTDGLKWGESPLTVPVDEDLLLKSNTLEDYEERCKLFENRDPRLKQTISHSGFIIFPEEGYDPRALKTNHAQLTNFGFVKYGQPTKEIPSYSFVSDQDVVLIRYAEVLLMIAEAENEVNGPTQKVYDAINTVRVRSHMPELPNGLTKDQMRERVRHEWRVEFACEGTVRYFQLKRWRLFEKLVNGAVDPSFPTYQKVFLPAFYYWPIPQTEIDKANGILTQDPNYE